METKMIMNFIRCMMLVYLFVFITSSIVWSKIYYVDKNNPLANNANSGTEASPWLTIQHAVDMVNAGDAVYIRGGIYYERVMLTGSNGIEGKSGNEIDGYITYAGYPGESIILDGRSFNWGAAFVSGKYAIGSRVVNYIRIKDLTARNYQGYGRGISFENNQENPKNSIGSHHIIIENVTICGNGNAGIWIEGGDESVRGDSHHIIVRNCHVYNNGNHGIKFDGDVPGVINREHIHDSIIEDCVVYNNGLSSEGIGIHVSTGHYDIIVRNNTVYNNKRQGIAAHEVRDSIYENNDVYSNGQGPEVQDEGIVIWTSYNMTIRGNIIHDNQGNGIEIWNDLQGKSTPTIENNIIYNNNKGGLSLSSEINNAKIYHNTIALNKGAGLYIHYSGFGHEIKNNIFYKNNTQISSTSNNNTFNYNLYYPDVSFNGKDDYFISTDPLFKDETNYNFQLISDSPAIDFGLNVGVKKDAEGISRPQGRGFDIGAYEYYIAPLPPTLLKAIIIY